MNFYRSVLILHTVYIRIWNLINVLTISMQWLYWLYVCWLQSNSNTSFAFCCRTTPESMWPPFLNILRLLLKIGHMYPLAIQNSKWSMNIFVKILFQLNYLIYWGFSLCRYNQVNAIRFACSNGVDECQNLTTGWYRQWMDQPNHNLWVYPYFRALSILVF